LTQLSDAHAQLATHAVDEFGEHTCVVDAAPASIARGLNEMLADPGRSRAMGEIGRAHVIAHYGWSSVGRRMADLYRSVLERRGLERREKGAGLP
jgi:glycosyltransferase involved in cell wall biosynthesis